MPEYIPNGFKLDSISYIDKIKTIVYTNSNNEEIVFQQGPNGSSFRIDVEDSKVGHVNIMGWAGVPFSKEGANALFWHNDEYSFFTYFKSRRKGVNKNSRKLNL